MSVYAKLSKWLVVITALFLCSALAFAQDVKTGGTVRVTLANGSATNNSNPFSAAGGNLPSTALIYEPLFYVNTVTGKLTPLLGTAYKWSQDNLTLTVETRQNVQWSDGKPFSRSRRRLYL